MLAQLSLTWQTHLALVQAESQELLPGLSIGLACFAPVAPSWPVQQYDALEGQ